MFAENLRIAMFSIYQNKRKVILILFTVAIGVATVTGVFITGDSVRTSMIQEFKRTTRIDVFKISSTPTSPIFYKDAYLIKKRMQNIDALSNFAYSKIDVSVCAQKRKDRKTEKTKNPKTKKLKNQLDLLDLSDQQTNRPTTLDTCAAKLPVSLYGTNYSYPELTPAVAIVSGKFFTASDELNEKSVCLVSEDLFQTLTQTQKTVVQKFLKIFEHKFKIIGVFSSIGELDKTSVIIPITTYVNIKRNMKNEKTRAQNTEHRMKSEKRKMKNEKRETPAIPNIEPAIKIDSIIAKSKDIRRLLDDAKQLVKLLKNKKQKTDFEFLIPIKQFKIIVKHINRSYILGSIYAFLILLSEGISIMSLMLLSISERRKEIGIRRAVGAKRKDIIQQFLIETLVLSYFGSCIGIIVGMAGGYIASRLFLENIPIVFPYRMAFLSFALSIITCTMFGVYPAIKASQMNPAEVIKR